MRISSFIPDWDCFNVNRQSPPNLAEWIAASWLSLMARAWLMWKARQSSCQHMRLITTFFRLDKQSTSQLSSGCQQHLQECIKNSHTTPLSFPARLLKRTHHCTKYPFFTNINSSLQISMWSFVVSTTTREKKSSNQEILWPSARNFRNALMNKSGWEKTRF